MASEVVGIMPEIPDINKSSLSHPRANRHDLSSTVDVTGEVDAEWRVIDQKIQRSLEYSRAGTKSVVFYNIGPRAALHGCRNGRS